MNGFLPVTRQEMEDRGWDCVDFAYIIGDAYVDHPSFGPAVISRVLESHGYRVGMIPQPDWRDPASIDVFGRPRLGFLVSGGNMDSMVNHYTVAKKRREKDAYTPGGVMGKRPDHAVTVYGNLIRQKYRDVPVILGGIEASLRRLAHYDYWSDSLKRSVLLDAQADLISYGMGERSIVAIAEALEAGLQPEDLVFLEGTVYRTKTPPEDAVLLPSYEELQRDRKAYARSFMVQYRNTDPFTAKRLAERYGDTYVVQNPPAKPLSERELDRVYELPYQRTWHPSYDAAGGIPALEEVKFSLASCRGCFGGCSFCSLTFHQGRIVQARSHESLLREAKLLTQDPEFKGYIHDVGGPTANFRHPSCKKQLEKGVCQDRQCLFPTPCKNLDASHADYVALLRKLRQIPGVKKVFIRSGVRFDYALADKNDAFIQELCRHHVSGRLKLAPEHVSDTVLHYMGKPGNAVYQAFLRKYDRINRKLGLKQYVVPYFMSSHPGSGLGEAVELALYLKSTGCRPEQVQDFYPTPSTLSTCMYYTGLDPRTMEPVYVERDPHRKAMQRALIQYRLPNNQALVKEALRKAGRSDLIGFGPGCLVPPRPLAKKENGPKQPHSGGPGKKKPASRSGGAKEKHPASRSGGQGKSGRPGGKTGRPPRGKR